MFGGKVPVEQAWFRRRKTIDFDATESAFAKTHVQIRLAFTQQEKRGRVAQQRLVPHQQDIFLIVKTGKTQHEVLNRAFRREPGDFFQLRFQAQGLRDDFRRLLRAKHRTCEKRRKRDI